MKLAPLRSVKFVTMANLRGRPVRILHLACITEHREGLRLSNSYEIDQDGGLRPLRLGQEILSALEEFRRAKDPTSDQVVKFLRKFGVEVDAVLGTRDDKAQGGPFRRAWQQVLRRMNANERALFDLVR